MMPLGANPEYGVERLKGAVEAQIFAFDVAGGATQAFDLEAVKLVDRHIEIFCTGNNAAYFFRPRASSVDPLLTARVAVDAGGLIIGLAATLLGTAGDFPSLPTLSITLTVDGTSVPITFLAGEDTVGEAVTRINTAAAAVGLAPIAVDEGGQIRLTSPTLGPSSTLVVPAGATATAMGFDGGASATGSSPNLQSSGELVDGAPSIRKFASKDFPILVIAATAAQPVVIRVSDSQV